jgi:tetratricopeptide (TPR) repeat protein
VTFKNSNRFFSQSDINLRIQPERNFALLPGTKNSNYFIRLTHINDNLFNLKREYEALELVFSKDIEQYRNNDYYKSKISEFSINKNKSVLLASAVYKGIINNYNEAISDLNNLIDSDTTNFLIYFSRANIRSEMIEFIKQLENESDFYLLNTNKNINETLKTEPAASYTDYNLVISDLNKAKILSPDFILCDYNLGNTYLQMRDYRKAIEYYNAVIKADNEFKEAYYNRGLTYIYLKENENGCMDMSKAGELGIEEAYQVIGRFCDK